MSARGIYHAWNGAEAREGPRTVFTIGRSPDCDLPLGDITVSWHHAELRHDRQAWVLMDLGSKNGTRVNGWRVESGFTVRAGDWVSFGRAAFRGHRSRLSRSGRR